MYTVNEGIAWQSSWWPASGYRFIGSEVLQSIGDAGCYWSSSRCPSDPHFSYDLFFNYGGNVGPSTNSYRSYGFAVRCIAE